MSDSPHMDFVVESREHLLVFERSMLNLEKANGGEIAAHIDAGFRAVHSLKGNAGFLGFQRLQELAHAAESVLEFYRDSNCAPSSEVIETLLLAVDRLSVMLADLEHSHTHDIQQLLEKLHGIENPRLNSTRSLPISIDLSSTSSSVVSGFNALRLLGEFGPILSPCLSFDSPVANWRAAVPSIEFELRPRVSPAQVHRELSGVGNAWRMPTITNLSELAFPLVAASLPHDASNNLGHFAYVPSDFSVGIPEHPILWNATVSNSNSPAMVSDEANQVLTKAPQVQSQTIAVSSTPLKQMELGVTPPPKTGSPDPVAQSAVTQNSSLTSDVGAAPTTAEPQRLLEGHQPLHHEKGDAVQSHQKQESHTDTTSLIENTLRNVESPNSNDRITSLRIQVDLLDRLMNLVGELTLVRNQSLLAFEDAEGNPRTVIQRLNSVTSELQDAVLKTRMQPVANLFGRFPRMVRDLGRQLGKQVELVMEGQEVELDKTVLEQLSDPLTHLIRNSVDHGLETPDVRQNAGKPPVGKVTLSAKAADGQVIIEIRDDGRGIDPKAVRAKVLALGLKSEADLQRISQKELYSYILLPGFSTAKQVSDVSGRGVGMDVVKTNVERLEGSLTIDSNPGIGTSMILRVPLTLAIIPCLIVTVGEERFAVPQRGLDEIVCLHPGSRGRIERGYDSELYRLRDTLLPVVRLSEVLSRQVPFDARTKAEILSAHAHVEPDNERIEYILVLRTGGRKFGLLVDDVRGTEEIVVKPMHPSLKKLGIFAGATLMGDGKVALIANIDGIAEHADCYGVEVNAETSERRDPAEVHRVLLFEYGPNEQFAVPLVQVRRIESIGMERVDRVGKNLFITIDGVSTRIVKLDDYMNVSACEHTGHMHLLLPKFVKEPMGILVSRIIDVDTLAIELQTANTEDPGLLGTAIIRGKLSLFVDTQYLRERLFGADSSAPAVTAKPIQKAAKDGTGVALPENPLRTTVGTHILLVDDTPFFREVVKRYFERIGLTVSTAVDGRDGLRQLADTSFDLVVSDIEMPNMDGWEFCAAARKRGINTPFLALTSLSKHEHEEKANQCGFDRFEEKLDHDRLIKSVRSLLHLESEDDV